MSSKSTLPRTTGERAWRFLLGNPKNVNDPNLRHHLSLIAFLAWIGLGVDGLSSSAYGPDEAFRALGDHAYLAAFLALASGFTIFVISYAYSRLIEHFPHGGGGYVVATQILGKPVGAISGCALLVDYVLTITVSVAGGGDAIFSLLPLQVHVYKVPLEVITILFLLVMNLRGLKESVKAVMPFFLLFLVTHLVLIVGGIGAHMAQIPSLAASVRTDLHEQVRQIGGWAVFLIFLKAYSVGAGTYTGIEAVSNGVGTLREPRVATGKRTMLYLAVSLSFTAGGLLLCFMLFGVRPVEGQTLNAVLTRAFAGDWMLFGLPVGPWFVVLTMFSEAVLLLIAAQTGFIDGPRVMANMAADSWLPKRFTGLSDRMTIENGILLIGASALALLVATHGNIGILIVMYSINVFITFSITEISMIRLWIASRKSVPFWKRNLLIHATGFVLCFTILWIMILEKFTEGAWVTLLITGACLAGCFAIRRHYRTIAERIRTIEERVGEVAESLTGTSPRPFNPDGRTAAILVGGSNRLGVRSVLAALRLFPNTFENIVFLSVGVINSEFFRESGVEKLAEQTEGMLRSYVGVAARLGLPARYAFRVGTDPVWEASELCLETAKEYPQTTFFAGELVFQEPRWFHRLLHNDTSIAIQRHIRFAGLPMVILPLVLGDGSGST